MIIQLPVTTEVLKDEYGRIAAAQEVAHRDEERVSWLEHP